MRFPTRATKKVYIDRKHVIEAQGEARPWIVEIGGEKWRGRNIELSASHGGFNIDAKPSIWLETFEPVTLFDAELVER